jgi:HlyD family secretion protein
MLTPTSGTVWVADRVIYLEDGRMIRKERKVPPISRTLGWPRIRQIVASIAFLLGLVAIIALMTSIIRSQTAPPEARSTVPASGGWQAVAPGRVQPLSSEVKITSVVAAHVTEVLVKPNDIVFAGEPLIRLKDDELRARLAAAEAQVLLHARVRDDQRASGKAADRRKAEDSLDEAESEVFNARATLDAAAIARRAGRAPDTQLTAARAALSRAQDTFNLQAATLRSVQERSSLPSQSEAQLSIARAERSVARAALDKLTIRAPSSGTVLQVNVKAGETAMPSSPLMVLGDISALRVRVELDDRDLGKIRIGQTVIVRTTAFPGREIAGKVATIAPMVGPASSAGRGQRSPADVDVAEVLVDLTDRGPLTSGMQVDVYFR